MKNYHFRMNLQPYLHAYFLEGCTFVLFNECTIYDRLSKELEIEK